MPDDGQQTFLTHLECARCTTLHDASVVQNLCRSCGGPLLARYDLGALATATPRSRLDDRPCDLWRYRELLPVAHADDVVSLGEPVTPLMAAPRLGERIGLHRLAIKNEGVLPTGSFKARGSAVGVTRARELGVTTIALPTAGNAGAAWSAYGARAGLRVVVAMPETTPSVIRRETAAYGAEVRLVAGSIADAGGLIREAVAEHGWFDASTLKEPYRIEGKKTIGFEIAEQLGWRLPDVIVYPTGGGVGLIGMWKAFHELIEIGWLPADARLPRFVAVQSTGCAPIVQAFESGAPESEPWPAPDTFAAGIRVPKALGDVLVLRALRETGGTAIAVSDDAIRDGMRLASTLEGMLVCPEAGACIAATDALRKSGWLDPGQEVVVINTGTGLKYAESLPVPDETGAAGS